MNIELTGKHIIVTGASGGIGSVVTTKLVEDGAKVYMVSRDEKAMKEIAKDFMDKVEIIPFDLFNVDDIGSIFTKIKSLGVKLDGLVYCAGISDSMPIKALDVHEMNRKMSINYYAYVEMVKYFANRRYSNDGSSVVAMSSIASVLCDAGMSQYSASKAAMNAVTKTMSKEYMKRHIRVNTLAPAFVDTKMAWRTGDIIDDFSEKMLEEQPFGVIPTDQISAFIEFLLSDFASYITGETIVISAGMNH